MGTASGLFHSSNDTEKQTLHRRITPSDEQFRQQQDRWNELADHLTADLRKRSDCLIRTWLQGSYKFGTQVRPPRLAEEFDIDLGIFYCWRGQAEGGQHEPNTLRDHTHDSLVEFAKSAVGVLKVTKPPKPRCARIHYEGSFHIDVPSYHLDQDADERTLAAKDGWEISDPKALYVWFKDHFNDGDRTRVRRQIRYLKCWAGLKWKIGEGRPSSVLLTVLASDAFSRLSDNEIGPDDDTLLALLRRISSRVARGSTIRNPVNSRENLNRLSEAEWTAFSDGIDEFIEIAESACTADNEVEAADRWSNAFAHFFPMPDAASAIVSESVAKSASLVPAMRPDVRVTAVARNNSNIHSARTNEIGPIPRDSDIRFDLIDPWKLPRGTTVEWIVRNEGGEAENINDMGHLAGTGYSATERSAYVGTHYMDCVLRNGGRVFGVRRIPVRVSGVPVALRNPVKRPAYARLIGRR
jgi:Adenylyl/Guanylyl and SMODS C-terminal sensor domain